MTCALHALSPSEEEEEEEEEAPALPSPCKSAEGEGEAEEAEAAEAAEAEEEEEEEEDVIIFAPVSSGAGKEEKASRPVTCTDPEPPASTAMGCERSSSLMAYSTALYSYWASISPGITSHCSCTRRVDRMPWSRSLRLAQRAFRKASARCTIASSRSRYHAVTPRKAWVQVTRANSGSARSTSRPLRSASVTARKAGLIEARMSASPGLVVKTAAAAVAAEGSSSALGMRSLISFILIATSSRMRTRSKCRLAISFISPDPVSMTSAPTPSISSGPASLRGLASARSGGRWCCSQSQPDRNSARASVRSS